MTVLKARQQQLLAPLERIVGIVERRHTLPILAHVMLRRTGSTLELTTSDLDLQLRADVALDDDGEAFAATVGARKLADILHAMPADQRITLTAGANRLTLQGGRSRYVLQTMPVGDFPLVRQAADLGSGFSVPQRVLKGLIDQVAFAMAAHDIRYFLNGMLFVVEGRQLTVVATDGNRLALASASVPSELAPCQLILPRKTAHELQHLLRDDDAVGDAPVDMRFAAAQAMFCFGGIEFVSKLIEGRFPDYKRVIPREHTRRVTIARAALLDGLRRASIMTSDKFRGVRVELAAGVLRIAASNAEREESHEEIEADCTGESLAIGFNVGYLIDVLDRTATDTVVLDLTDAGSGALFSFPGRDEFRYVVSPMRL